MISTLFSIIEETLIPLGGVGVFIASLIEEVIAPIPSALVQMAAGLLLPETISVVFVAELFLKVIIPASLGVALGSLVVYYIGFYAGKPALQRWGRWFGLRWRDVDDAYDRFQNTQTDVAVLFFLRAAPIVPSVAISAVCGVIRMPVHRYLLYTILGTAVRAAFLGMIGWQVGGLYKEYYRVIDRFESSIFVSVAILFFVYILYRLVRKRQGR